MSMPRRCIATADGERRVGAGCVASSSKHNRPTLPFPTLSWNATTWFRIIGKPHGDRRPFYEVSDDDADDDGASDDDADDEGNDEGT